MKVSISRTSWHAMTYKWFYHTYEMPSSLCPYFWKLVLAMLCAPFVHIVSLPAYILVKVLKWPSIIKGTMCGEPPRRYMYLGIALYACIYLFVGWILHIVYLVGLGSIPHTGPFVFFNACLIISNGIFISSIFMEKAKEREYAAFDDFRDKNPNLGWKEFNEQKKKDKWYYPLLPTNWLITMYFIAWFKDMCPIIDWKQ